MHPIISCPLLGLLALYFNVTGLSHRRHRSRGSPMPSTSFCFTLSCFGLPSLPGGPSGKWSSSCSDRSYSCSDAFRSLFGMLTASSLLLDPPIASASSSSLWVTTLPNPEEHGDDPSRVSEVEVTTVYKDHKDTSSYSVQATCRILPDILRMRCCFAWRMSNPQHISMRGRSTLKQLNDLTVDNDNYAFHYSSVYSIHLLDKE